MSVLLDKRPLDEFLKAHGEREHRFAASLQALLKLQAREVLDRIREESTLPPDFLIFDREKEHTRLIGVARRHAYYSAELGAQTELNRSGGKAPGDLFTVDLPDDVLDAITRELEESFQSEAWQGVTATTGRIIRERIEEGIANHETNERVASSLFQKLTDLSRPRARAIARTETTGSLNAGHHAARQGLVDAGLLSGQQWLAIGDDDVRTDHGAIDGAKVGPKADFYVGGFPAPYPGHWSLPAEQRVNCRCTTIGLLVDDDGEFDD